MKKLRFACEIYQKKKIKKIYQKYRLYVKFQSYIDDLKKIYITSNISLIEMK